VQPKLLAANHLLLGSTNIGIIPLPDGWALATGRAQPEVDGTVDHGGCRWMRGGHGWYWLWPASGRRHELVVHASPAPARRPPALARTVEEGTFAASGHQGRYRLGFRSAWVPRPAPLPHLWAEIACDRTRRWLALELMGPAGSLDLGPLEAFLRGLEGFRCH
jgi:hypothetical protein